MADEIEHLFVKVLRSEEEPYHASTFAVEPPLTGDEVSQIEATQAPRSILVEVLSFLNSDTLAEFTVPSVNYEIDIEVAEELAKSLLPIRGLAKATVEYESGKREIEI